MIVFRCITKRLRNTLFSVYIPRCSYGYYFLILIIFSVYLTCNGRKTDSIVAALGWSGAGATVPPRPFSTLPANESCGPGKQKRQNGIVAKHAKCQRKHEVSSSQTLTLRGFRRRVVRQERRRGYARYLRRLEC